MINENGSQIGYFNLKNWILLIIIFEIGGRRGARAINQRLITWRAERESNLFRNKHDRKKRTR